MGRYFAGLSTMSSGSGSPGHPDPFAGLYSGYYPPEWGLQMSAAGVPVTPEVALTLSAWYSGLTRIAGDFMRMPAHVLKVRDDGGKDRIRGGPSSGALGKLAYRLRWQPNASQTAAAFFGCLAAQYTAKSRAYAEIVVQGGDEQYWPRHPDRVEEERLPSGRLRFKILEPGGREPRYVTQQEMIYLHDTSSGGFSRLSRLQAGTQAIGTSLAADRAAGRFYQAGMTAAVLATHPNGAMDEEARAALHADITRFATGKEHNFGLLLVEEDIKVSALGLNPEQAQMMSARNYGVREVARYLRMPPELLFADNTGARSGTTWEEIKSEYHTGCLGSVVVTFEQAMQLALVTAKDTYVIELLMDALFRGDLKSRSEYYAAAIEGPWMWPSEIRVKEGLNPDRELDAIAEKRYRPADPKGSTPASDEADEEPRAIGRSMSPRASYAYHMLLHDAAVRVLRRERAAVEKLAKKHPSHVEAWHAGLRDFFTEHAGFVAETLRIDVRQARAYCAQHGTELEAHGVVVYDEQWERREADELVGLALDRQAAA